MVIFLKGTFLHVYQQHTDFYFFQVVAVTHTRLESTATYLYWVGVGVTIALVTPARQSEERGGPPTICIANTMLLANSSRVY